MYIRISGLEAPGRYSLTLLERYYWLLAGGQRAGITLQRDAANIKRGGTQHTFLGFNRHQHHPWGRPDCKEHQKQLIRISLSDHIRPPALQGHKTFVGPSSRPRTIFRATDSWVESRRHFTVILPDTHNTSTQQDAVRILQNNIDIRPVR